MGNLNGVQARQNEKHAPGDLPWECLAAFPAMHVGQVLYFRRQLATKLPSHADSSIKEALQKGQHKFVRVYSWQNSPRYQPWNYAPLLEPILF